MPHRRKCNTCGEESLSQSLATIQDGTAQSSIAHTGTETEETHSSAELLKFPLLCRLMPFTIQGRSHLHQRVVYVPLYHQQLLLSLQGSQVRHASERFLLGVAWGIQHVLTKNNMGATEHSSLPLRNLVLRRCSGIWICIVAPCLHLRWADGSGAV